MKSSGLSIANGKRILVMLQGSVVKQELVTYAAAWRVYPECERRRPVKDYTMRKIRTVFGTVEVKNARWMLCQGCLPHMHGVHGSQPNLSGSNHAGID